MSAGLLGTERIGAWRANSRRRPHRHDRLRRARGREPLDRHAQHRGAWLRHRLRLRQRARAHQTVVAAARPRDAARPRGLARRSATPSPSSAAAAKSRASTRASSRSRSSRAAGSTCSTKPCSRRRRTTAGPGAALVDSHGKLCGLGSLVIQGFETRAGTADGQHVRADRAAGADRRRDRPARPPLDAAAAVARHARARRSARSDRRRRLSQLPGRQSGATPRRRDRRHRRRARRSVSPTCSGVCGAWAARASTCRSNVLRNAERDAAQSALGRSRRIPAQRHSAVMLLKRERRPKAAVLREHLSYRYRSYDYSWRRRYGRWQPPQVLADRPAPCPSPLRSPATAPPWPAIAPRSADPPPSAGSPPKFVQTSGNAALFAVALFGMKPFDDHRRRASQRRLACFANAASSTGISPIAMARARPTL